MAFQEALFPGAVEEKKRTEVAVLDRTSGDRWNQDRMEGEGHYDQNDLFAQGAKSWDNKGAGPFLRAFSGPIGTVTGRGRRFVGKRSGQESGQEDAAR